MSGNNTTRAEFRASLTRLADALRLDGPAAETRDLRFIRSCQRALAINQTVATVIWVASSLTAGYVVLRFAPDGVLLDTLLLAVAFGSMVWLNLVFRWAAFIFEGEHGVPTEDIHESHRITRVIAALSKGNRVERKSHTP